MFFVEYAFPPLLFVNVRTPHESVKETMKNNNNNSKNSNKNLICNRKNHWNYYWNYYANWKLFNVTHIQLKLFLYIDNNIDNNYEETIKADKFHRKKYFLWGSFSFHDLKKNYTNYIYNNNYKTFKTF